MRYATSFGARAAAPEDLVIRNFASEVKWPSVQRMPEMVTVETVEVEKREMNKAAEMMMSSLHQMKKTALR